MATKTTFKPLSAPLDEPEVLRDWQAAIQFDVNSDDGKDALEFVRFYEDFLKKNLTFPTDYRELAAEYDALYDQASWLALPYLTERDGLGLFESRLAGVFKITDYNFVEKIRLWLLSFPLDRRDEIKAKISELVGKSSAIVTKNIAFAAAAPESGTVKRWVNYYLAAVGTAAPDPLKQSQFYFSDRVFNSAAPEERAVLKRIFDLLDKLRLSSKDPAGYEEEFTLDEDGEQVSIVAGEELKLSPDARRILKTIRRAASPEEERARLVALLGGSAEEVAAVRDFEAEYSGKLGSDGAKLRDELFSAINPPPGITAEPRRVVALLKLLARSDGLDTLVRSDKRFFDLLAKYYEAAELPREVEDLKVYPTAPKHLAALLRVVLCEKAGLASTDAARLAIQLANILKKGGKEKYLAMAYFDEEAEDFRFAD